MLPMDSRKCGISGVVENCGVLYTGSLEGSSGIHMGISGIALLTFFCRKVHFFRGTLVFSMFRGGGAFGSLSIG